jgi:two-component system, response regulator PdtaR
MTHAEHTVLVVEDEPLVRELMVEALSEQGWHIVEAATADEALKVFLIHPEIGVLFTDITMPGTLDGCDLAREIHARRPEVSVVLTSGRSLPANCHIPEGGIFIRKPYSQSAVVGLISGLLV